MLPELLLPVRLGRLEGHVVARDVPAAVFFAGYPAAPATAEALHRWRLGLLSRVVVAPPLRPELVARLGVEAERLVDAYLRAVGYHDQDDASPAPRRFGMPAPESACEPEDLRAATALPPSPWGDRLAELAEACHLPPWTVWQWPISELLWTMRLLSARARERGAAPAGLPPSVYAIGLEGK